MGKTEEYRCNFFAVRLRALGFDGMRCVIECNHNNVPFGMLSKVHRCINKMHLILSGQTGERNSPLPSPDVIGDTKPIAGENEAVKFFQMPRFALLSLLSVEKGDSFSTNGYCQGKEEGGREFAPDLERCRKIIHHIYLFSLARFFSEWKHEKSNSLKLNSKQI